MACRSVPVCESRRVKSGLIPSNKGPAREGDWLEKQVKGRGKWVLDLSWVLIGQGPEERKMVVGTYVLSPFLSAQ